MFSRLFAPSPALPNISEHRADKFARNRTPPPEPDNRDHAAIHAAFVRKWSGELRLLIADAAPIIDRMPATAGARTAWRDANRFVRGGYVLAQCPTPDAIEGWHRILSRRIAVGR
jgi:hypothetical protein